MQEDVLEIQCPRPQEAMDLVADLPGVKEAALFGNRIHAVTESREKALEAIHTVLSEKGYLVEKVERIVPSMEDVFVSLIENRDRAEQPQQEVRR